MDCGVRSEAGKRTRFGSLGKGTGRHSHGGMHEGSQKIHTTTGQEADRQAGSWMYLYLFSFAARFSTHRPRSTRAEVAIGEGKKREPHTGLQPTCINCEK